MAASLLLATVASCGGDDSDSSTTDSRAATEPAATDASESTDAASVTDPPSDITAGADTTEDVADDTTDSSAAEVTDSLQVTEVDFTTGMAMITNVGDEPYDVTGHWFCNRPNYEELPGEMLDPGASIEAGFGDFSPDGGETAVYSSGDFGSSEAILAYVTWGSAGGRLSVAEEAGIWSGDPVIPSGDVITLSGDPVNAAGWDG